MSFWNRFINNSFSDVKQNNDNKTKFYNDLQSNIEKFRKDFDNSIDLTIRIIDLNGTKATVFTMEGMINKEVLSLSITNPIINASYTQDKSKNKLDYIKNNILSSSEQIDVFTFEDGYKLIMSGFALLAIDGCNYMVAIGVQGFSFRSISDADRDVVQNGSKEGFVEPLRINMTLIRRRLKNPALRFETMTIGSVSQTDICLCYLNNMVSSDILKEIKKRLKKVNLQSVLSSGYLTPYLEEGGDFSLFSGVGVSERPDTVCGKMCEGRVAIIVDGSPGVLIVPFLFVEYFQTLDDYSNRAFFATFTRWLKYTAFFISVLLPGLYVAVGSYYQELFPSQILNKVVSSIEETPFPLAIEALIIHFIYEIMREAGLRMPQPLGHAVSIVGALVIGETSVNSGLIGAPTLMVVALTAIASYVIPKLYAPIAILRVLFIIAGGLLGIWGVVLLLCVVLVNICSKTSFGIPYTSPVAPFSLYAMRDVFVRAGWKILSKKEANVKNMPGSNVSRGDVGNNEK